MKILITSSLDPLKSAHSRLHEFIKYLVLRHQITILCIDDIWKEKQTDTNIYNKNFQDYLTKVNIIYLSERKYSPVLQELFAFNCGTLVKEKFDVHINYASFVCGYTICKKLSLPTIYDIADDWITMVKKSPQIPRIIRPLCAYLVKNFVQKNICHSTYITYSTKWLKEQFSIPEEKSIILPNGVDIDLFKNYSNSDLKTSLKLSLPDGTDYFVIGYIGVLREWVDFEPFFSAIKELQPHYNKIRVLIVGEEGGIKKNMELAKKYGILNEIIFTGTVEYELVPQYISCMDVCIIPFKKDPISDNSLPLKLFEYMACEKPVISSHIRGVMDAVGNKILYASTKEEYINIIPLLYEDSLLRSKLGKNGREYVCKNFAWSQITAKLEGLLNEMKNLNKNPDKRL